MLRKLLLVSLVASGFCTGYIVCSFQGRNTTELHVQESLLLVDLYRTKLQSAIIDAEELKILMEYSKEEYDSLSQLNQKGSVSLRKLKLSRLNYLRALTVYKSGLEDVEECKINLELAKVRHRLTVKGFNSNHIRLESRFKK